MDGQRVELLGFSIERQIMNRPAQTLQMVPRCMSKISTVHPGPFLLSVKQVLCTFDLHPFLSFVGGLKTIQPLIYIG